MKKSAFRAFSLVECIIALGVVSVSLVSLLGMLAGGYGGLRKSINFSTQAQIVQKITAEIQMLDFSVLVNEAASYQKSFPRYYTDEGMLQDKVKANYEVTLALNPSQVPGGIQNSDSARQVIVRIANLHQQDYSKSFCIWAVNNGR